MWPSFSEKTIYMSSFILWAADDEPASETEISQLQQLPTGMNEFRLTLASVWCNFCTVFTLPRPQAWLLGRAWCALGYGIDSARFARRRGIDANEKSNAWQILFGFLAEMFGFSSKGIFSAVLMPYVKELSLEGS